MKLLTTEELDNLELEAMEAKQFQPNLEIVEIPADELLAVVNTARMALEMRECVEAIAKGTGTHAVMAEECLAKWDDFPPTSHDSACAWGHE